MLTSALFAFTAICQLVASQTTITPPADTPPCVLNCTTEFCPDYVSTCLCQTQLLNIEECIFSTCDVADQETAEAIASEVCGNNLIWSLP
jgi:hypothetical protein